MNHSAFNLIPPIFNSNLRPRVLTYVKKSSQLQVSPRYHLVTDPDLQILEVELSSESFYVVHIYNEKPTSHYSTKLTVERFMDLQLRLDKPMLFLGDFNLHHSSWNPLVQNSSPLANKLAQYLDNANAQLLNSPSIIEQYGGTFHRSNSKSISIIDLTFAIGFKHLRWGNWKYGESTGSDHEVNLFDTCLIDPSLDESLNTNRNTNSLPTRFNVKKADWELFKFHILQQQELMQQTLETAIHRQDVDGIASILQQVVQSAAQESIPLFKVTPRSKPWWTKDLRTCSSLSMRKYWELNG